MSGFIYSDDNKRYHTLHYYNKHRFGGRMYKAAIDAGLTCPNKDGTRGVGGCIFCDSGSGYFTAESRLSIAEQFRREEQRIRSKTPDAKILAYFQANSNTYCSAQRLSEMLREAVSCGASAISVATRADCIDAQKAEILAAQPLPVTVELGLQSAHDSTAALINRCHTCAEFTEAFTLLKSVGLRVCVHIINGLPQENEEMMLETARFLANIRPDAVKIHLLHVIEGTALHEMYLRGEYTPLEKQQYIDIVVKQLELLPPETVIERLTGDGDKSKLAAPLWSTDKISVLGGIDKRQRELDSFQGRLFEKTEYISKSG